MVESGLPVWKTSLTIDTVLAIVHHGNDGSVVGHIYTFVEAVHVQLSHKRRDIRVLEILTVAELSNCLQKRR